MAKLEKRQMIILGVMVLVIFYAAYDFLALKKKGIPVNTAQQTSDLNAFVAEITAGMGKGTTAGLGALIFSRAEKSWMQDPFLNSKSYKAWTQIKTPVAALPEKKIDFVYSGFIGAVNKYVAVINGMEYKEGEPLDIAGYVLRSISPASVVIEKSATGTMLNIPLHE